ncbi:MAG: RluA family pseudouridine synthase [Pseudomonadota bacterium]
MTETVQRKIIAGDPGPTVLEDDIQDEPEGAVESELREVQVPLEGHGDRLDRVLAAVVPEFSRTYLQQLIGQGLVSINGQVQLKTSGKVKAGERLKIELRPTAQSQAFKPESIPVDVVFEDAHLLVLNKPAGLVVHPAPGNWSGTLLNALLARDESSRLLPRAGIVHRLDKDTSGLMMVAKTRECMDLLVQLISERSVGREYVALAHGIWSGSKQKQVNLPIGRDPRNRLRMAVVDIDRHAGKTAITDMALIDQADAHCLVRCRLQTGRTHQIRVHMASLGHPLVADSVYGGKQEGGLQRQGLHAWRLSFEHPLTGAALAFSQEIPPDMAAAMAVLGLSYNQPA